MSFINSRWKPSKSKTSLTLILKQPHVGAAQAAAPQAVVAAARRAIVLPKCCGPFFCREYVPFLHSVERRSQGFTGGSTMLLNDLKDNLRNDLKDELHQLETETFEVEDLIDLGLDAAVPFSGSSSCSTSSCCSCSTSSCCSTSTSCTG